MEVMSSSRGLFGLALVGFLFKLNLLENYVGTWEKLLNVWELQESSL
jgi:hypothetical protein